MYREKTKEQIKWFQGRIAISEMVNACCVHRKGDPFGWNSEDASCQSQVEITSACVQLV